MIHEFLLKRRSRSSRDTRLKPEIQLTYSALRRDLYQVLSVLFLAATVPSSYGLGTSLQGKVELDASARPVKLSSSDDAQNGNAGKEYHLSSLVFVVTEPRRAGPR